MLKNTCLNLDPIMMVLIKISRRRCLNILLSLYRPRSVHLVSGKLFQDYGYCIHLNIFLTLMNIFLPNHTCTRAVTFSLSRSIRVRRTSCQSLLLCRMSKSVSPCVHVKQIHQHFANTRPTPTNTTNPLKVRLHSHFRFRMFFYFLNISGSIILLSIFLINAFDIGKKTEKKKEFILRI